MLNITIDKVRHIEDKDANVRETLVELQHALDKSEQERHFYDALDRKSTRLNSSHCDLSRMPSSA